MFIDKKEMRPTVENFFNEWVDAIPIFHSSLIIRKSNLKERAVLSDLGVDLEVRVDDMSKSSFHCQELI